MRKEIYKVKCPQHIVFGDPMYFERFRGNELNRLTVTIGHQNTLTQPGLC